MTFALSHDVHFVTAHPCLSSHSIRLLHSPASPSLPDHAPPSLGERSHSEHHRMYSGTFLPGRTNPKISSPSTMKLTLITRPSPPQVIQVQTTSPVCSPREPLTIPRTAQHPKDHDVSPSRRSPRDRLFHARTTIARLEPTRWWHAEPRLRNPHRAFRRDIQALPPRELPQLTRRKRDRLDGRGCGWRGRHGDETGRRDEGDAGEGLVCGEGRQRHHQQEGPRLRGVCRARGRGSGPRLGRGAEGGLEGGHVVSDGAPFWGIGKWGWGAWEGGDVWRSIGFGHMIPGVWGQE